MHFRKPNEWRLFKSSRLLLIALCPLEITTNLNQLKGIQNPSIATWTRDIRDDNNISCQLRQKHCRSIFFYWKDTFGMQSICIFCVWFYSNTTRRYMWSTQLHAERTSAYTLLLVCHRIWMSTLKLKLVKRTDLPTIIISAISKWSELNNMTMEAHWADAFLLWILYWINDIFACFTISLCIR